MSKHLNNYKLCKQQTEKHFKFLNPNENIFIKDFREYFSYKFTNSKEKTYDTQIDEVTCKYCHLPILFTDSKNKKKYQYCAGNYCGS
jgi:formylmethanofuran dehydrogenase subunit E